MMPKKLLKFVICGVGLLMIGGCIDTINVDLPDEPAGRLVVDGVVERSPDIYRFFVRISSTGSLNIDLVDNRESADVELIYNGQSIFNLINGVEDTIGVGRFHQLYGGSVEDALFNIRVTARDNAVFESQAQRVLDGPEGSTLQLAYEERPQLNELENLVVGKFVKVQVKTPVVNARGERVSMRWDISGVYRFPEVAWTDNPFFFPKTCLQKGF